SYWRATRGYPLSLVAVFGSAILMQVTNLVSPLYLRQFFNVLAGGTPSAATGAQLVSIIVVVAVLLLLNWALTRVMSIASIYMQSRVMQSLYGGAFAYLLGHSYSFFISRFAGSITHKVSRYARGFEMLMDAITLQFFPTFLFVTGAVIVLSVHNIVLGAMLGGWAVLLVLLQIYLAKRRQPFRAERAEAESRVTGGLADAISNQNAIDLFSGDAFAENLFRGLVATWHRAKLRVWYADEFIWASLGLFFVAINVALLYGATIFWQRGELTLGDFVLIQSYL